MILLPVLLSHCLILHCFYLLYFVAFYLFHSSLHEYVKVRNVLLMKIVINSLTPSGANGNKELGQD